MSPEPDENSPKLTSVKPKFSKEIKNSLNSPSLEDPYLPSHTGINTSETYLQQSAALCAEVIYDFRKAPSPPYKWHLQHKPNWD